MKDENCKTVKLSCRVQSCIDSKLYEKLYEYMEECGYDDLSTTIRNILKIYFECD